MKEHRDRAFRVLDKAYRGYWMGLIDELPLQLDILLESVEGYVE